VVLHGAFVTIELLGKPVPGLAASRPVSGVELQGHGHTADAERPIASEQLAEDTAALLRHRGIASASHPSDGMDPEVVAALERIKPETFDGTPWRAAYDWPAPHPEAFPTLVAKLSQLDTAPFARRPVSTCGPAATRPRSAARRSKWSSRASTAWRGIAPAFGPTAARCSIS
jgi:hypothetical protein